MGRPELTIPPPSRGVTAGRVRVKMPEPQGGFACGKTSGYVRSCVRCPGGDMHGIDQTLASKTAFRKAAQSQGAGYTGRVRLRHSHIRLFLPVHMYEGPIRPHLHRHLMPHSICNGNPGVHMIRRIARRIYMEHPIARRCKDFPMCSRGLGFIGNENVVGAMPEQFYPAGHRNRQLTVFRNGRRNQGPPARIQYVGIRILSPD
ncbi:MAG: hypothetical protein BWY09_02597 [Candidatus Hydrogenedentes bacterium ADurb.Bin179]|nr:MAG: hypothetical protein BWY09_02597 [Candidatus Hydrogenedentes bacterium ADurb.Bin179]